MNQSVWIALFGWPLVAAVLFTTLSPRRAVIANYVAGWLILPVAEINIPGFVDMTKAMSVSLGALVGVMVFDANRLTSFRVGLLDLPALGLVLVPLGSSISNGLGVYDGLSGIVSLLALWGIPWLMGRLYITDRSGATDLATGVILGALAYVPVCIWEMRMSPQLHASLYGYQPFTFYTTRRFGGWRPVGFLRHGIELGMWMLSGAVIALSFWRARSPELIARLPTTWVAGILWVLLVLTRALGAWILGAAGAFVIFFTLHTRRGIVVSLLILTPITYVGFRFAGGVADEGMIAMAEVISEDRASSLGTRLYEETRLVDKALERPFFGWGGWGRGRIKVRGEDDTLIDGLWIVLFSKHGLIGLASWFGVVLLTPLLALQRMGAGRLAMPSSAAVLAFIVLLPLHAFNWMLNGFVNPVYVMMAASLVAVARSDAYRAEDSD